MSVKSSKEKVDRLLDDIFEIIESEPDAEVGEFLCRHSREFLARKRDELQHKQTVAHAKFTSESRLKPDDRQYGVHMSHCYGEDWENPGTRFSCKYGEDDICPAAQFEDPWKAYLAWEESKKTG